MPGKPELKRQLRRGGLISAAVVLLLLLQLNQLATASDGLNYAGLLNLSGQQRMLTQQMSKEVLLIAMGVSAEQNLAGLRASSSRFGSTLKSLQDDTPNQSRSSRPAILLQLKQVNTLWQPFYKILTGIIDTGRVTPEQLNVIAAENIRLLNASSALVELYEREARRHGLSEQPELAVTLNLAGQQRLLTQKMTKEYLLIASGHEIAENRERLRQSYVRFDRVLNGLLSGDRELGLAEPHSRRLHNQLQTVRLMWLNFMPLIKYGTRTDAAAISDAQVSKIARSNLPLLHEMNRAVGIYQQQASH